MKKLNIFWLEKAEQWFESGAEEHMWRCLLRYYSGEEQLIANSRRIKKA